MQLFGAFFGAITTAVGVIGIIEAADSGPYERSDSSVMMWLLLVSGTGVARSLIHRSAGAELIYGQQPYAGIKKYFVASLVNTGAWLAFLGGKGHMPGFVLVPVLMLLISWPLVLLVMTSTPGFREMADKVPAGEDKGFEGAALLMLMFGLLGFIATSIYLYALWTGTPGEAHSSGMFMMIVIALVVLIIRSGIHVGSALTGLRETRLDQVVAAVNRYCDFGVVASFIAGGCLLLSVMMLKADVMALVGISCIVWALLAWPLTLRRFFGERQFADLMAQAEGGAPHHRAPDLGLTTLGWFLFAQAVVALSYGLPSVLMMPGHGDSMASGGPMLEMLSILNPSVGHSPWWSIGLGALQLWAGFELIRMSELHRIAASAFGLVTSAIYIYFAWPMITHLGDISRESGGFSFGTTMAFGGLALQLTVPLVTLFAANRSHVPAATARYT
ncbi:MAG TPA: hypothetical protein VL463_04420 [Kofleriaceae bacterium]|nr:hypothetical protein [Kofleriaceae bacterium]